MHQLQLVSPWGWEALTATEVTSLLERLRAFESMTWNQILVEGKKRHHSVPVFSLCSTAKRRLEQLRLEDVDEMVSLSVSSRGRIWGIRDEAALLLLWWDPDHEVCPSSPKNT